MTSSQPPAKPTQSPTEVLGALGEALAWQHLQTKGYRCVATNWHAGRLGEVDLIVACDVSHVLVFVEVKARRGVNSTEALLAITPRKQRQLLALAAAFLARHPQWDGWDIRVDAVGVAVPRTYETDGGYHLIHIENAVVSG